MRPQQGPTGPPTFRVPAGVRRLDAKRRVVVLRITCPLGTVLPCTIFSRVTVRLGGRRLAARVEETGSTGAGGVAVVRAVLTRASERRLGRRTASATASVTYNYAGGAVKRTATVRFRR